MQNPRRCSWSPATQVCDAFRYSQYLIVLPTYHCGYLCVIAVLVRSSPKIDGTYPYKSSPCIPFSTSLVSILRSDSEKEGRHVNSFCRVRH